RLHGAGRPQRHPADFNDRLPGQHPCHRAFPRWKSGYGRKVFQPELKQLAEDLAKQVVNIFKRYLYLMREDTGAANLLNDTDTYHWLEQKKNYRTDKPLEFVYQDRHVAYASCPSSEQDVIAVFHELVGMGVIQGLRFLATTERDRYDGCYVGSYSSV